MSHYTSTYSIPDRRPGDPGYYKPVTKIPENGGNMQKTYKAVFSVGVGKDKNNFSIPFSVALENRQTAISYAAGLFGGVTVTENFGGWNDNGFLVTEESWAFIVVSDKRDKFREFGNYLKDLYNQSAVLLAVTEVESEFI